MPDLSTVYAVETRPGFYHPRSQASDTQTDPHLWVRRLDAARKVELRNRLNPGLAARVVAFRLVPVEESPDA